jgi:serine-type D-Ala-D-Ala carboxypeptidase/endopeptidase (penicillin-binding protein 4)
LSTGSRGCFEPSHQLAKRITAFLLLATLTACTTLEHRAARILADPALDGARWGMVVTTLDGRELVSIRPDDRFVPASNTKLFTTAAAFHSLTPLDAPDPRAGASLRIVPRAGEAVPDLLLVGGGDGRLADTPDCLVDCLASLAQMAIQNGITRVHDVIGDDRLFPDERWGAGWSWNNMITRSGTAISALTINDNELSLDVTPSETTGAPPRVVWRDGDDILPIINDATTVEEAGSDLRLDHLPNANSVRLYGKIGKAATEQTLAIGVDDPAQLAAHRFRRLLEKAGVTVEGAVRVQHRAPLLADDPTARGDALQPAIALEGTEIGRLLPNPLSDDIRITNKVSQNVYAELILRRLGLVSGSGSAADGQAMIDAMLIEAGVPRSGYELADGSGMSNYNRVSPRLMVRFLRWTTRQTWGEAWRATLPIGGVDGTLSRRFVGTPLEGRIFAKTGSLNAVSALSGFMTTARGRTLIFSIFANDRQSSASIATPAMDAALLAVAAAN